MAYEFLTARSRPFSTRTLSVSTSIRGTTGAYVAPELQPQLHYSSLEPHGFSRHVAVPDLLGSAPLLVMVVGVVTRFRCCWSLDDLG